MYLVNIRRPNLSYNPLIRLSIKQEMSSSRAICKGYQISG